MDLSDFFKRKAPAINAPAPADASPAPERPAPVPPATMPPEITCRFCGRHFAEIPLLPFCPICHHILGDPVPADASPAPEPPAPVPPATMPPETTCRFCGWRFTEIPKSRHCPICCSVSGEPGRDQPLIPTEMRRSNGQGYALIDLNALPSDDTLIVVASTHRNFGYSFAAAHQLRRVGHATYESSAFGWMERRKTGDVFCIDRSIQLSGDALQTAAKNFNLLPYLYKSENLAFLMEEAGVSDFCIEIAAITGIRAEVLYRCCSSSIYDILISDIAKNYSPPRLISLTLDE
ncbi:MAG: hypothetical protein IKK57_08930 [Clostridia bacterium]|nr:hypothetical protein [Clostridia bacterium]